MDRKVTPEDLRASILQAAIQGKLVHQNSNDEPASVLLDRIREEKCKLVKEGKIKKDKHESFIFCRDNHYYEIIDNNKNCIDNQLPYRIPDSWEWVRLGSLLSEISDGTHKTPRYTENGIPFLSVQNISKGHFDLTKTKYISPEEHNQLIKRCHPKKRDILLCRIGTLGKAIVNEIELDYSIFVNLALLRPIDKDLSDYITLIINSP